MTRYHTTLLFEALTEHSHILLHTYRGGCYNVVTFLDRIKTANVSPLVAAVGSANCEWKAKRSGPGGIVQHRNCVEP